LDWHDDALAEESAAGGHFSGTGVSRQVDRGLPTPATRSRR
jgi:hypothetical protein